MVARPGSRGTRSVPGATIVEAALSDERALRTAFEGCEAVVHCAGINRERGGDTFEAVHVRGTATVVVAARAAGVRRLALLSFLRARPDGPSRYHRTKATAEAIVRDSGLDVDRVPVGSDLRPR